MTPIGGKKDPQDQILESCLEEILGGQTPPDLKAEILARYATNGEQPAAPPVHVSVPPVTSAAQRLGNRNQTEAGTPARRRWIIASLVTSTAVAALIMISIPLLLLYRCCIAILIIIRRPLGPRRCEIPPSTFARRSQG